MKPRILMFSMLSLLLVSGCVSKDIGSEDYWKNRYENECYGTSNMISQLQAESVARHYAQIQVNLNAGGQKVELSDIDILFDGPRIVGEECNPDWFVIAEVNDTNKETYRFHLQISGELVNKSLQGVRDLPRDYVLSKVELSVYYHAAYDDFQHIGGGSSFGGP